MMCLYRFVHVYASSVCVCVMCVICVCVCVMCVICVCVCVCDVPPLGPLHPHLFLCVWAHKLTGITQDDTHTHTHTHTHTAGSARLSPLSYSRPRGYDTDSLLALSFP